MSERSERALRKTNSSDSLHSFCSYFIKNAPRFARCSLCHDIDHPGNTNSFEIAMDTELSRLHSDDSVLERHHSATTLNLLNNSATNILGSMKKADVIDIRNVVIKAILGTDMGLHAKLLGDLVTREPGCFDSIDGDNMNAELIESYIAIVMHTSDLSANCLPR